jgi:hypothetical protein
MDRMASMAVFTKMVGAGSFSAAAREMKLSQASATMGALCQAKYRCLSLQTVLARFADGNLIGNRS